MSFCNLQCKANVEGEFCKNINNSESDHCLFHRSQFIPLYLKYKKDTQFAKEKYDSMYENIKSELKQDSISLRQLQNLFNTSMDIYVSCKKAYESRAYHHSVAYHPMFTDEGHKKFLFKLSEMMKNSEDLLEDIYKIYEFLRVKEEKIEEKKEEKIEEKIEEKKEEKKGEKKEESLVNIQDTIENVRKYKTKYNSEIEQFNLLLETIKQENGSFEKKHKKIHFLLEELRKLTPQKNNHILLIIVCVISYFAMVDATYIKMHKIKISKYIRNCCVCRAFIHFPEDEIHLACEFFIKNKEWVIDFINQLTGLNYIFFEESRVTLNLTRYHDVSFIEILASQTGCDCCKRIRQTDDKLIEIRTIFPIQNRDISKINGFQFSVAKNYAVRIDKKEKKNEIEKMEKLLGL